MRLGIFLSGLATLASASALVATSAAASTITLVSDGSTLGAATDVNSPALTSGDTSGLTFGAVDVGAYGTFTSPPTGAPSNTEVINIAPADGMTGQSGLFLIDFTLPSNATSVSISGAANVDDAGLIFINGNQIGGADEFDNLTFSSNELAFFNIGGVNQFVVSDINSGGGPSGAAFYATVDVGGVPEPASWALMLAGFGGMGAALRSRRRRAIA